MIGVSSNLPGKALCWAAALVAGALGGALAVTFGPTGLAGADTTTLTFNCTGSAQTWTVPAGVTSATVDAFGAQGGAGLNASGGLGGRATASIPVTPGQTIQINVGCAGKSEGSGSATGGFVGGGPGGTGATTDNGGGGGGASDVRTGAFGLADRVLVAGGGGGAGCCDGGAGGAGGGASGMNGASANAGSAGVAAAPRAPVVAPLGALVAAIPAPSVPSARAVPVATPFRPAASAAAAGAETSAAAAGGAVPLVPPAPAAAADRASDLPAPRFRPAPGQVTA